MAVSKTIKPYKLKKSGETRYKFKIRTLDGEATTRRGFLTVKEAQIAYMNLKEDILTQSFKSQSGQLTYKEVFEPWFKRYEKTVKPTTFQKTKTLFDLHIIPYFGDTLISEINVEQCERALDHWTDKLIKYKTTYSYANHVFKEAMRLNYIDKNPMDKIIVPKRTNHSERIKEKRNKQNFYSEKEQVQFLEAAKKWGYKKYAFFRLLSFSGMRREEILALQWKDLNGNMLTVDKALVYVKGTGLDLQSTKNGDTRILALDPDTIEILNNWKEKQRSEIKVTDPDKQLIFSNKFNKWMPLTRPHRWQVKLNKDIELNHNVTIHGFRHTHGTLLLDNNNDLTLKDIQKRLGHRDLSTTMIYLHATEKSDDKILDALNNLNNDEKNVTNNVTNKTLHKWKLIHINRKLRIKK